MPGVKADETVEIRTCSERKIKKFKFLWVLALPCGILRLYLLFDLGKGDRIETGTAGDPPRFQLADKRWRISSISRQLSVTSSLEPTERRDATR